MEIEKDILGIERLVIPLVWTDVRKPDCQCHYTHCIAETPFGRFLLTWLGWEVDIYPMADETPWGEFFNPCATTVAEAQASCELEYTRRLVMCFSPNAELTGRDYDD